MEITDSKLSGASIFGFYHQANTPIDKNSASKIANDFAKARNEILNKATKLQEEKHRL